MPPIGLEGTLEKLILCGLFLILGLAGPTSTWGQTRPPPSLAEPSAVSASRFTVYEDSAFTQAVRSGTRSRTGRPGPRYWQQYARYEIDARLDTATHRLDGRVRITYSNRSPDTLARVAVHLRQNLFRGNRARRASVPRTGGMSLESVDVNGTRLSRSAAPSTPGYSVDGTVAWIRPPRALLPDDSLTIQIRWHHTPPPSPADGRQGREGDIYFFGYWYPQLAVYDDVHGWVAEPYTGQSEFYMGQADYDVHLTVPSNWLVGATGQLQNPSEVLSERSRRRLEVARTEGSVVTLLDSGERGSGRATRSRNAGPHTTTWHFRAHSVRDFAWGTSDEYLWDATRALVPALPPSDSAGDASARSAPDDTVLVHSFYRPTEAAGAWQTGSARYTRNAVRVLSSYLRRPYPYPTMTSMEGVLNGGGMEYPMVTVMRPWADTLKLAGDLMHEVGHMWVPMEVGTNEKRYPWMDEGLTQYNTAQGMRRLYGPGPRPRGRPNDSEPGQRRTYLQIARNGFEVPLMRHGDDIPPSLYFDLPYDKAAQVLSALRAVVGPPNFRDAYRAFLTRWWGKHPTPYDFFNTFADVTGRDLSWFWHTWFYTTATLDQTIASVETGRDSTTITVGNEGRAPMPVRFVITRVDGTVERHTLPATVWFDERSPPQLRVDSAPPIRRVEIDPEGAFPDLDRSNQVWTRPE